MSYQPRVVPPETIVPYQGYCGMVWDLIEKNTDAQKCNLALITVDPGKASTPHGHHITEEIYYILNGEAEIVISSSNSITKSIVSPGYAILIPAGWIHVIRNNGIKTLKLLALNSPPYNPADTFSPTGEV